MNRSVQCRGHCSGLAVPRWCEWLIGVTAVLVLCSAASGATGEDTTASAKPSSSEGPGKPSACCAGLSDSVFQPLYLGKVITVSLREESPTYPFETGVSRFAAFRLPPGLPVRQLRVTSLFGVGRGFKQTILLPQIVLLNDRFEVTRQSAAADFEFRRSTLLEPGRYEATLVLDPQKWPERYAIVRTTDAFTRLSLPLAGTGYIYAGAQPPAYYELPMASRIRFSPVGELRVIVE